MKQELVQLNKNQIIMEQDQEIFGLFIMKDKEQLISNIKFINDKPNSLTRITLKFIMLDESVLDLEATAVILNGAKQTDTYLKIDCLLLSDKAKARIIPCMEIMENDVKGGHGATIGMIDDLQKWYLTSRGIDENTAEKILIEGFAKDIIESVNNPEIKESFEIELKKLYK